MSGSRHLRAIAVACAGCALAGTLALAGVGVGLADQTAAAEPAPEAAVEQVEQVEQVAGEWSGSDEGAIADLLGYTYLDLPSAQSGVALKAKAYSKDGPIVTELPDGRFVQRTPSENITAEYEAEGAYSHPQKNVLFNCAYLKADERGCNACHDDLGALLDTCSYGHSRLSNNLGIDLTLQMCIDCHTVGDGYQTTFYDFGTLIHGIHQDNAQATCASCHNMTEDGEGIQLWDVVKHDKLRGISSVPDAEGEFDWNQTDVIAQEDLFNYSWFYFGSDYLRNWRAANAGAQDTAIYDEWTISVGGEVNEEVSFTLADLVANAPIVTKAVTMQCTLNPTGGPYLGNCVVTGIPLEWLIEQAGGLTDAAYGMYSCSADGNANSMLVENLEGRDALVVYQIDGKPLNWLNGFPAMLWVGGTGAPINCKELTDILFVDEDDPDLWEYVGWETEDGDGYYNKPQAGIWGTPEGLCIQAGEPYTFRGYATSWDQQTVALEFSLDGGWTWTHFDLDDADLNRWVSWSFTWTPEEGLDTAYVLKVRSVTADGETTPEPVEVMVNAKSDLAAFAEQVRAGEGAADGLMANQAVVDGNVGVTDGPAIVLTDPAAYADDLTEEDGKTPNLDLLLNAAVVAD